jgi:hypothetical protein
MKTLTSGGKPVEEAKKLEAATTRWDLKKGNQRDASTLGKVL